MNTSKPLLVKDIEQIDKYTLGIEWTDGHKSSWRLSHLRRNCPCAMCIDENSGEKILDPNSIDNNITCTGVQSVGRYALKIDFSDGHSTGIYTFKLLRELDQNS